MKGYEIAQLISNYPILKAHFFGIFSLEFVQNLEALPILYFAIVNTSTIYEEGIHWFLIFRESFNKFEVFNSQGFHNLSILKPYIFKPLNSLGFLILNYNKLQYQPDSSVNCGYYSIFFAVQRLCNLSSSFKDLLKHIFDPTLSHNEKIIYSFFKHESD